MMGILLRSDFYPLFFLFDQSNKKREKWIELEKKQKKHGTVPETDAGGQVENTKAFEITTLKELGKLTL